MKPNYVNILGWMYDIGCDDLSEIVAYAAIFGFSQDGESKFQGSLNYIAQILKCTKPTAIAKLKALEDKGLIQKEQVTIQGVTFNRYQAVLQVVKNLYHPGKEILPNNNIDNTISTNVESVSVKDKTLFEEENNNPITPYSPPTKPTVNELSQFEKFRKAYKGTKRGLGTEFDNFRKKHKDWREVLPHLLDDYLRQEQAREANRLAGAFVPQPKNLSTYINQRCWEEEIIVQSPNDNDYARQSFDREIARQRGKMAARAATTSAILDAAVNACYAEHRTGPAD